VLQFRPLGLDATGGEIGGEVSLSDADHAAAEADPVMRKKLRGA
jgi:hypothetical protein